MPRTVAQAAAEWIAVYVQTARSARNVLIATQRVRDYLSPFMGGRGLEDLGPDDFRRYRLHLQDRGLAPRTVRHVLTDARCMLGWATDTGLIGRSPFPRRIMPRIQETPPDRLTDDEVAQVLDIPEPQAFLVRFGLATGLRWAEICRAQARDLQGGMLLVHHTKSGRSRRVPVPPAVAREIRGRVGRLVTYGEGSAGSFAKFVRRHTSVARFHVHQLRHTFACRWIESGGTLASLQQILGHASVVTTQHYARLSDESIRREAERIYQRDAQGALSSSDP